MRSRITPKHEVLAPRSQLSTSTVLLSPRAAAPLPALPRRSGWRGRAQRRRPARSRTGGPLSLQVPTTAGQGESPTATPRQGHRGASILPPWAAARAQAGSDLIPAPGQHWPWTERPLRGQKGAPAAPASATSPLVLEPPAPPCPLPTPSPDLPKPPPSSRFPLSRRSIALARGSPGLPRGRVTRVCDSPAPRTPSGPLRAPQEQRARACPSCASPRPAPGPD